MGVTNLEIKCILVRWVTLHTRRSLQNSLILCEKEPYWKQCGKLVFSFHVLGKINLITMQYIFKPYFISVQTITGRTVMNKEPNVLAFRNIFVKVIFLWDFTSFHAAKLCILSQWAAVLYFWNKGNKRFAVKVCILRSVNLIS